MVWPHWYRRQSACFRGAHFSENRLFDTLSIRRHSMVHSYAFWGSRPASTLYGFL